ncbi:MAG: hypothetical protein H0X37_22055 [Herpetosiphonaceae bacterium]|nr:hypothetical protein [Herpetosiphonaceae bacterium]
MRRLYTLGERVIAEQTLTSTSNTVAYLHGDHLGSVSAITTASGSVRGGGAATLGGGSTTPLTVDFHEPGFAIQLNQHNAATCSRDFWFQLISDDQHKAVSPLEPMNPQTLNRNSYVLNNPLHYTGGTLG